MHIRRTVYIILSSLAVACSAMAEPTEKTLTPDAVPTAGSRYQYAMTVTRRSEIPVEAKEKQPEMMRAMDCSLQGDVTVTITAVTPIGYELHWQANMTEPTP